MKNHVLRYLIITVFVLTSAELQAQWSRFTLVSSVKEFLKLHEQSDTFLIETTSGLDLIDDTGRIFSTSLQNYSIRSVITSNRSIIALVNKDIHENYIATSSDQGNSWSFDSLPYRIGGNAIGILNNKILLTIEGGFLVQSDDFVQWDTLSIIEDPGYALDIKFVNDRHGILTQFGHSSSSIHITSNGGIDWRRVELNEPLFGLPISMHKSGEVVIPTGTGKVFISYDYGLFWDTININPNYNLTSCTFLDEGEVLISGRDWRTNTSVLIRSKYKHSTWSIIETSTSGLLGVQKSNGNIFIANEIEILKAKIEDLNESKLVLGFKESKESIKPLSFALYPSPSTGVVQIETNKFSDRLQGTLFSSLGRRIMTFDIHEKVTSLELQHLPKGVYFLRIFDSMTNIEETLRFVLM